MKCGYLLTLNTSLLLSFTSYPSPQSGAYRLRTFHIPGHCLHLLLFSRSVMSHCLQPHGLQHTRPPCPSPTLEVHSDSCPLSGWCHPTIKALTVSWKHCRRTFHSGRGESFQFCKTKTCPSPPLISPGARTLVSPTDTKSMHHSVIKTFYVFSSLNSHLGGFCLFFVFCLRRSYARGIKEFSQKNIFLIEV